MNLKQKYFNFLKKSREENLKDDIKNLMALREVKTGSDDARKWKNKESISPLKLSNYINKKK